MPVALLIAFAASLGIHIVALFGPDIDMSTEPETPPLMAELKPQPTPPPLVEPATRPEKPAPAKTRTSTPKPRPKAKPPASATPLLSVPGSSPQPDSQPQPQQLAEPAPSTPEAAPPPVAEEVVVPPVEPRLPPRGKILYRVDRGDSNFEIGVARHEWEIADGRYHLSSVVETTGLVWLFKAYRIDMQSDGAMTAAGLQPERFAIRRNGQETREQAVFDWDKMTVRVGGHAEQALAPGAQDLLSFNYQLGFLPHLEAGSVLPIATGRKYGIYRLEVLGDEDIEVPAGQMRTLHLRAPGENTTELWLAYDYLLLPVKIRHVDAKGDSFVQVATQIQVSPPSPP
jgi:hypothetical protein